MIIATFPKGVTAMTVNGLHQWDYGQQLQVSAEGLPALVEVHFACPGMTEAIVRTCSAVSGFATAPIPDKCLEQTAPVTAWVYLVDETSGTTALELTLPITARTRPQAVPDVPQVVVDRYNELIATANEAIVEVAASAAQAKDAASSANSSASSANSSVTQAKNAASSASASASSAGGYASAASSSAASASASASEASSSASAASASASSASASASEAAATAAALDLHTVYVAVGYNNNADICYLCRFSLIVSGGSVPSSSMTRDEFAQWFMSKVPQDEVVPASGCLFSSSDAQEYPIVGIHYESGTDGYCYDRLRFDTLHIKDDNNSVVNGRVNLGSYEFPEEMGIVISSVPLVNP